MTDAISKHEENEKISSGPGFPVTHRNADVLLAVEKSINKITARGNVICITKYWLS